MAGDDAKKPAIPSWQQQGQQAATADEPAENAVNAPTTDHATDTATTSSPSPDQVRAFLADAGVRDAPEEKKRAFLVAKGASKEIINEIMLEHTQSAPAAQDATRLDVAEFKAQASSSSPPPAQSEGPPIITYPEFLIKPQKPPPLVTINGLLTTAYIAGGLATLFHGASRFLLEPMAAQLTEDRHDFATHAESRVSDLSARLEKVVSKVPASKPKPALPDLSLSDAESVTSDPTELFHRDMGVQTSPSLSRRTSSSSSSSSITAPAQSPAENHIAHISKINSHLRQLLSDDAAAQQTDQALDKQLSALKDYLNTLVYAPHVLSDHGIWPAGSAGAMEKNDALAALRREVRGVKGVLLSARRFPASTVR